MDAAGQQEEREERGDEAPSLNRRVFRGVHGKSVEEPPRKDNRKGREDRRTSDLGQRAGSATLREEQIPARLRLTLLSINNRLKSGGDGVKTLK